MKRKGYAFVPI